MKQLIKNIIRIIQWIPILWEDRDWDYTHLYQILQYKISRMRPEMTNHENSELEQKHMRICENLLQRLMDDKYDDFYMDKLENKYGDYITIPEKKGDAKIFSLSRNKIKSDSDKKEYSKDCKKYFKLANKVKENDKDLLFKIMKKRIEGWWN